jgi:DNA replication and repair protein RecF
VWLKTLDADRLRNLKAIHLDLPQGLTMVTGRNAQGKTTLLEGIYLLGTGRSFRTRRMDEMVGWSGGPLRVSGAVERRTGDNRLTIVIDSGERSLLVDDAEHELVDFIGHLDVVDLTHNRMGVLRGSPEERRRFLDRGVVGLQPAFLKCIGEYRRVLKQRNALLRGGTSSYGADPGELDAWDQRLAHAGAEIHAQRAAYIDRLAGELGEASRILFPEGDPIVLRYSPSPALDGGSDLESGLYSALQRGRIKDQAMGHTFRGPHRDDLVVELNGIDLRKYGSAGQLRASMIALKLG